MSYSQKISKMTWSFSRLSTYENCPYEFYLNYLLSDEENYPPENNYYAEQGSFVHKILQKILSGELSENNAAEYYYDNYDYNVLATVPKSIMDKSYDACLEYFSEVRFDALKDYKILGVELETNTKIDKYKFIGYIDLLLKNKKTDDIIILDHKSSPYPFNQKGTVKSNCKEKFESYRKQMYIYAKFVYENYGAYPKYLVWNHFKDGGKIAKIDFNKTEYDDTLEWCIDTIHKIENDKTFDANFKYFYCKNLCSFRNSCEYAEEGALNE